MSFTDLSTPYETQSRLQDIERDLAARQNAYESAAGRWYTARRDIERARAQALLTSDGPTVTEKKAEAELAAFNIEGSAVEAEYEALKAVIRMLETRAMVLMALLKSQGRAGG